MQVNDVLVAWVGFGISFHSLLQPPFSGTPAHLISSLPAWTIKSMEAGKLWLLSRTNPLGDKTGMKLSF